MRPSLVVVAALALACSDSFIAPGLPLVGTWSNPNPSWAPIGVTRLEASAASAMLVAPCWEAQFGPLRLDDTMGFHQEGIVTEAGGLITLRAGDSVSISGRVLGSQILVDGDTLFPGSGNPRVCNA